MLKKMGHWLTDPARLPYVVLFMLVMFMASASVTAVLYVQTASVRSEQTAQRAAEAVARQVQCDGIRTDIGEPTDPPPVTDRGKVLVERAKARYVVLHCDRVPPLAP